MPDSISENTYTYNLELLDQIRGSAAALLQMSESTPTHDLCEGLMAIRNSRGKSPTAFEFAEAIEFRAKIRDECSAPPSEPHEDVIQRVKFAMARSKQVDRSVQFRLDIREELLASPTEPDDEVVEGIRLSFLHLGKLRAAVSRAVGLANTVCTDTMIEVLDGWDKDSDEMRDARAQSTQSSTLLHETLLALSHTARVAAQLARPGCGCDHGDSSPQPHTPGREWREG